VVGEELGIETLPGIGSVKLRVREPDAERATKVLARRPQRKSEPVSDLPGDQLAARALNAASLGLFILPVVFHVYSAFLLLRIKWYRLELSGGGRKQVREAWKVNRIILIGAAVCIVIGFLLWWYRA
jgi:hypothetical protein